MDLAREIGIEQLDRDLVQHLAKLVRRELDGAVEAMGARIAIAEGLRHDEQRVLAVPLAEQAAPALEGRGGVRDDAGAVEHEQGPALHPDVARVLEAAREAGQQPGLVLGPVVLGDEHVLLGAVPAPGPVLVGPHQAEREVHAPVREHRLQGRFQEPAAVEGVEIPDEALDPRAAGEPHLLAQRRRALQPVVPEVARDARLVVPGEARQAPRHVGPLREAPAPPLVVLRDRMELGQVEGEDAGEPRRSFGQRRGFLEECVPLHIAPDLARDRRAGNGPGRGQVGVAAVAEIVEQRDLVRLVAQVARAVEGAVEAGVWLAVLPPALDHVMLERVHASKRHVRIRPQVVRGVELLDRADEARLAQAQEVAQAQLARGDGVPAAIPGRVEPGDRAPALGLPPAGIVEQRVHPRLAHVVVAPEVIPSIKVRIGPAAFFPAPAVEVRQRIQARGGEVRVAIEKPSLIEQAGLAKQEKVAEVERRRSDRSLALAEPVHCPDQALCCDMMKLHGVFIVEHGFLLLAQHLAAVVGPKAGPISGPGEHIRLTVGTWDIQIGCSTLALP